VKIIGLGHYLAVGSWLSNSKFCHGFSYL